MFILQIRKQRDFLRVGWSKKVYKLYGLTDEEVKIVEE